MEWLYNLNGFWIFPLFCLLFMALMMLGCRGMRFGFGHGGASCRGREGSGDFGAPLRERGDQQRATRGDAARAQRLRRRISGYLSVCR